MFRKIIIFKTKPFVYEIVEKCLIYFIFILLKLLEYPKRM